MSETRPAASRRILLAVKILVSVGALWLVTRRVDFQEMGGVLTGASGWWLLACVTLQVGVAVLNGVRWKLLMGTQDVPLGKYLYYVFVGQLLNVLLPSAAFAEVARTYAFGKRYGMIQKNMVAMVVLRGVGLASSVLLAAGLMLAARADVLQAAFWAEIGLSPLLLVAALLAAIVLGLLARTFFRKRVVSVILDARDFLRARRVFGQVFLVSLLIQLVMAASVLCLFRSVHWDLELWQAASIPVILQVLLLLPVSLGGVGVREYLSVILYQQFAGVASSTVLAATVLSYIPLLVVAGMGGAWMLYRRSTLTAAMRNPRRRT